MFQINCFLYDSVFQITVQELVEMEKIQQRIHEPLFQQEWSSIICPFAMPYLLSESRLRTPRKTRKNKKIGKASCLSQTVPTYTRKYN